MGFTVVPFGQGFKDMSPPSKEFYKLRMEGKMLLRILRIGLPVAAQDGFIQVSFILITILANQRGLTDAAAVGIVEKIMSFLFLIPSSMLSAVSAIGAQNIGAGKPERARQTLGYAILIAAGVGLVLAIWIQFTAQSIVALFTQDAAVAAAGGDYLRACSLASAGISVPAASPGCRFCTIFFLSFWRACPAHIWPASAFPTRCIPWAWPRRRGRCCPSSSA